jgi:hypothetical protein
VIGYNASADTFQAYNPWGIDQPGLLTWSQLQAECQLFTIADTSNVPPISMTCITGGIIPVAPAPLALVAWNMMHSGDAPLSWRTEAAANTITGMGLPAQTPAAQLPAVQARASDSQFDAWGTTWGVDKATKSRPFDGAWSPASAAAIDELLSTWDMRV